MSQLDDLNRIVASLNGAALGDTNWPATSALIDEACRAKGSFLLYGQESSSVDIQMLYAKLCYRGQHHRELEREYYNDYYSIDERVPRIRRLPDSKVVHIRNLYTDQELKTSPAYNEILPRGDHQNGLNIRLDGPNCTRIVWSIADPMDKDDWSSGQIDMIERLLPHLRQYVGVQ